jgi:septum formation protein
MKKIILASQSPARKKILTDLGYTFEVIKSDFEEYFDTTKTPQQNAKILAEGKANNVFEKIPPEKRNNYVVIGVDTIIVDPNKKFLEKPKNRDDAEKMMSTRSGQSEVLLSGICILSGDKKFSGYEGTRMEWQTLSSEKIKKILDTGEWEGKCGGVAVEGFTGLHVKKIFGNYQNIMGFPVNTFLKGMKKLELKTY